MAGAMLNPPSQNTTCLDDPNFATICSFIEKFGETCHIGLIPFKELQFMLENTNEVPPALAQIHIKLLRRVYKSINADKWEKHLAKFCHSYNSQDAWELERFGYKKSKIQTKLRLLKNLLEAQFDYNTKFKNEVNKLPAESLRLIPLGRDFEGQAYWYQVDTEGNLRVYREDADDDTWELVATDREQMVNLIQQLESGIVTKNTILDENGSPENEETSPKEPQTSENEELPATNGLVRHPNEPQAETSNNDNKTENKILPKDMVVSKSEIPKITETLPNDIFADDDDVVDPQEKIPEITEAVIDELEITPADKSSLTTTDLREPETPTKEESSPADMIIDESKNFENKESSPKPEPEPHNLTSASANEVSSPKDMVIDEVKISKIKESSPKPETESANSTSANDESSPKGIDEVKISEIKESSPKHEPESANEESSPKDVVVDEIKISEIKESSPKPGLESENSTSANEESSPKDMIIDEDDTPEPAKTECDDSIVEGNKIPENANSSASIEGTNHTIHDESFDEIKDEHISDSSISADKSPVSLEIDEKDNKDSSLLNDIDNSSECNRYVDPSSIKDKPTGCPESNFTDIVIETKPSVTLIEPKLENNDPPRLGPDTVTKNKRTESETNVVSNIEVKQDSSENAQLQISSHSKQLTFSTSPKPEPVTLEITSEPTKSGGDSDSTNSVAFSGSKDSIIELSKSKEPSDLLEVLCEESKPPVENSDTVKSEKEKSNYVNEPVLTKSNAWVTGDDSKISGEVKLNEYPDQKPSPCLAETKTGQSTPIQGNTLMAANNKPDIKTRSLGCLVGYDSSSDDGDKSDNETVVKRKSGSPRSSPPPQKIPKLSLGMTEGGPIIGEAFEETVMIITGQGAGAECEGGVDTEVDVPVKGRGSGGRRGRPRGGGTPGGRTRKRSSSGSFSGSAGAAAVRNGRLSTERPTRQSSRIAKIQEREESERRKQEEERLAQLKQAQIRKQQKMSEKETKSTSGKSRSKISKSSVGESKYLPTPSATDSSGEENDEEDGKSKKKRGRPKKYDGAPKTLMKKGLNPWVHSSSEEAEDDAVEEEEEYHEDYHEEEEDLTLRSDHEFSPESDLEEDDQVLPSRHARTAKRDEAQAVDKYATTNCEKCSKGDHPEWILLCDSCDKGCHASCVRPQLWVIPEGQWFCQPCQHKMLIEKMNQSLTEYDQILKKHENEVLRKERLAYVGISLNNVLPEESETHEIHKHSDKKKKKKRRHISSEDEEGDELMENSRLRKDRRFIDSEEDESNISTYTSKESAEEEEDEPIYKLRARRTKKAFNFQEYDEMINSALKEEDEVPMEGDEPPVLEPELNQNGQDPRPPVSKGKVMPDDSENEENTAPPEPLERESTDEDELDEKEKKRREDIKKNQRKTRRRLNDLDATDDDDSDEDFKESELEDEDDEEGDNEVEDEDSEWSGDRDDESDDSLARRGKSGKYGRQDKYLEVGSVRRSTRKARRKKVVYDESDQEDDDEAPGSWNEESGSGASESNSESDQDATWGKRKKKKGGGGGFNPSKPKGNTQFFMGSIVKSKNTYGSSKKKKKKVDEDEVDKPWNRSKKVSSETLGKRSTRGKKINFKDILDSGESDDDGNIIPKRRRLQISSSEDSDHEAPSSSKKLMAEINAAKSTNASNETEEIEDKKEEPSHSILEEELMSKPVPAPPLPPSIKKQLLESSLASTPPTPPPKPEITVPSITIPTPPPISNLAPVPVTQMSTNLMMSEILSSKPSKKKSSSSSSNSSRRSTPSPASQPPPIPAPNIRPPVVTTAAASPIRGLSSPPHQSGNPGLIGPNVSPSEIARVPNPAYFPPNPGMRFPWIRPGVGAGPPYGPPTTSPGTGPVPLPPNPRSPSGKPPPLNNSPPYHVSQRPPSSSPYPNPPPLRIPNPNVSSPSAPLQSFQQFKRDSQLLYRLQQPGGPAGGGPPGPRVPPGILPHLTHPVGHDRFFGSPHHMYSIPSQIPYGIPPPHTQAQPLFNPGLPGPPPQAFEFRPEDQAAANRSSSPRQMTTVKEENSDGEFGGLVSYFSSQRGEEDMDT